MKKQILFPGSFRFTGYLLSIVLALFQSCNVINPADPVPAYIHIDSMSLSVNYATQGSASSKISDAWVFVDNQYLGTYPLPTTFPVIGAGNHKISVGAGIISNGISANRTEYPKYQTFDTTLNLQPKQHFSFSPVISYFPSLVFAQIEDFDDGSLSLINTNIGTASLSITGSPDPNAFERNSGVVRLDTSHAVFEVASSDSFPLPTTVPVYVELNYKGDAEFTVGAFINTTAGGVVKAPLINVRASSTWKKIYINMSETGGIISAGIGYKVYLHAELPSGTNNATLYFDNLKVVY